MENGVKTLCSRKQAVPTPSNNIDILHKKKEKKINIEFHKIEQKFKKITQGVLRKSLQELILGVGWAQTCWLAN